MRGLQGLNEPQRTAVRQTEGPVLILAGAGTGKTRVITTRIAYLLAQDVPAEGILAVTFTNKAANEMRERVASAMSREEARGVMISTFHSLCVRILRRDIDRLGYKKNFAIYAAADQLGMVRKLIVQQGGKESGLDAKAALGMIGQAKGRGLPPSSIAHEFGAEIARCYQDELRTLNAVDFDDLLLLAVRLLEEHGEVREHWQDRFRYLMVDEFQDTNGLQMALLRHLAGEARNVCVVGDDDQSIYGWRGADIRNILEFERYFPDPAVVKLEENYRCTAPVLQLANSIIRHNRDRRDKTLWCRKESNELVRLMGMPSAEEEAAFIVDEIVTANRRDERAWEDFAILFRMNAQSRLLEQALRAEEVPYRVVGGMSFFDRREIRDLLSYLMVLLHPEDDVNLLRIINNPPRGIGQTAVAAATEFSMQREISVWRAIRDPEFLESRTAKSRAAFQGFASLLRDFMDVAQTPSADYATLTGNLVEEIGYLEYLKRTCKTAEEAGKREESLREFIDSVFEHRARSSRKQKGLQHFLDEVQLSSDREEEDISKRPGVCLITLHAAKGLEFPVVYLVGLEEGLLPHSRSLEEGSRDEERRLLYVGMTRAMESLTLSYCSSRKRYGEASPCQPSSFIGELDRRFLEEISYDELANAPATEEAAADYFDQLKEMLASG